MRVSSALALLFVGLAGEKYTLSNATEVNAGRAEHLVAKGGECIRLFHSKGDIGCRSLSDSDMAPLYPIEKEEDWDKFKDFAKKKSKYALVLPETLVMNSKLEELQDQIGGLFIYPSIEDTSQQQNNISFASSSPQGQNTPDGMLNPFANKQIQWNPNGTSLMEKSFSFPMFLLKDDEMTQHFLQRALKNQKDDQFTKGGPEYKAFMNYYFGPKEMNSLKCLENKNVYGEDSPKCGPIGGQSVWAWRGNKKSKQIIMISTNMDSNGLSHVLAPGANTAAANVVALLVAAKALQIVPDENFEKKIVFSLFQGEKFGFVGSRKFLSDLKLWKEKSMSICQKKVTDSTSPFGSEFCTKPLMPSLAFTQVIEKIENIEYLLGIDQVGLEKKESNFKVYLNPNGKSKEMDTLLNAFTKTPSSNSSAKVEQSSIKNALPPNSLLSFINEKEYGIQNLAAGLLTGYDKTFPGQGLYESRHDVVGNLNINTLTQASQILAEAIYTLSIKKSSKEQLKEIKVNATLVEEMVTCLSSDWRCDLMDQYSTAFVETQKKNNIFLSKKYWPSYTKPATLYTGTYDSTRQSVVLTNVGIEDKPTEELTEYDEDWSDEDTKLRLLPNAYEVFTQAFLSSNMIDPSTIKNKNPKECSITQDCEKDEECVINPTSPEKTICTSRQSFFHDAVSPGLKRTETIGVYDIVDENMPLWTEPIWNNDIGSFVFPDPGVLISWLALCTGLVITVISFYVSRFVLQGVQKLKLL